MSKVRNKDSKIEVVLREALWKEGYCYRKNSTKYFGKRDIVLQAGSNDIEMDSFAPHQLLIGGIELEQSLLLGNFSVNKTQRIKSIKNKMMHLLSIS